MFQYAYGRAQAEQYARDLHIDLSHLFNPSAKRPRARREFRLNALEMDYQLASPRVVSFLRSKLGRQINKANLWRLHRNQGPLWSTLLVGYWQSPCYFSEIETLIRRCFRLKGVPSQAALAWQQKIQDEEASVMLHMRHGDYQKLSLYDVCTPAYFHEAMAQMEGLVSEPHFYVFSDDIPWCRSLLKSHPGRVSFVTGCASEVEELHLMTCCHHHIIPNSSFSWWGAWLGAKAQQVVLAPNRWLRDDTLNEQFMTKEPILLDDWIRVSTG